MITYSKAVNSEKAKSNKKRERYLVIPYHILNLIGLGLSQKVLLSHIYSFGTKGCYQSNKTLGEIFMVSAGTIKRWIADIDEHLYIKNPKGYYRTMWAKSHPEVKVQSFFAHKQDKKSPVYWNKSVPDPGQKRTDEWRKNAPGLAQNCTTTNNNTNKETNKVTTPPPSLPAGGQTAAVLKDREAQVCEKI